MNSIFATTLRICTRLSLLACVLPLLAHANLPASSSVPGGVAIVPLAGVSASVGKPQTWFGGQPVLVTAFQDQWYAVVGLSLDLSPGLHELSVAIGSESKTQAFEVSPKKYPQQHITLKDKSRVQLSAANQARAAREIAAIRGLKRHWRSAQDTDLAFIVPAEGQLSGRFGSRRYFNGEPRQPHAGLDVAVASGTPVRASAQGKVLAVEDYFFNGKTVFVDHGNGLITLYCHLEQIDVHAGETVDKGQLLGLSGQTGRATGPHLHWSVVLNGVMVDPELFILEEHLQQ